MATKKQNVLNESQKKDLLAFVLKILKDAGLIEAFFEMLKSLLSKKKNKKHYEDETNEQDD